MKSAVKSRSYRRNFNQRRSKEVALFIHIKIDDKKKAFSFYAKKCPISDIRCAINEHLSLLVICFLGVAP